MDKIFEKHAMQVLLFEVSDCFATEWTSTGDNDVKGLLGTNTVDLS